MAKKKKRRIPAHMDAHANCDHSPEAHAIMARFTQTAGQLFMSGVEEGSNPISMMIGCILIGIRAGVAFPGMADKIIRDLGMTPPAIAELNEAAAELMGAQPTTDKVH